MRTICKDVFTYQELSKDAQETARDWYRECSDGQFEGEYIQEDAKNVGLIIESLDQHRANRGHFEKFAENTAERILKDHGAACGTYKDAKIYLDALKALPRDEDGELSLYDQDKAEEFEKGFLHDLLEDYRIMLEKEYEYQNSDEVVAETIEANGYEFFANGERI